MYAELHCHSSFSFLDGASSPEDLAGRAKELGLRALALTDRDGLYGAVRFHQAARAAGLQSILGAEVTLDSGHHLTLLVRNEWGYRNLSTLLTLGRTRRPKGESAVTFAEVEKYADGLIVLSGCPAHGLVAAPLATGDAAGARRAAGRLREAFGDDEKGSGLAGKGVGTFKAQGGTVGEYGGIADGHSHASRSSTTAGNRSRLGALVPSPFSPPQRAIAQEFGVEHQISETGGYEHLASPFRDRSDAVDFVVFVKDTIDPVLLTLSKREIVRLEVLYGATPDVPPVVQSVTPIFRAQDSPFPSLAVGSFNPTKADIISPPFPTWPLRRWFAIQFDEKISKIRLDADATDSPVTISTLTNVAGRNYPHWFGHGDWAVYEADSPAGLNDATYRSRFDTSSGPLEEPIHEVTGEVNEQPRGSPASNPAADTYDRMIYAKSIGIGNYARAVYRMKVGDPDDFFLTVGADVAWIDEENIAFKKTIQGYAQVFRSAWNDEALAQGATVLLSNGTGGLLPKRTHPGLRTPSSITLGDFNSDAIPDACVANQDSGSLSFLMGNGDGRLSRGVLALPPSSGQIGPSSPYDLVAGDLDLDDDEDLVLVERDQDRIRVLLWNAASGKFELGPVHAVGDEPVAAVIGNFNPSDPVTSGGPLDTYPTNAGAIAICMSYEWSNDEK